MRYYIDLKMLPEHDMTLFQVWSSVFMQVHLALVECKNEQQQVPVGVSFPEYVCQDNFTRLGQKLRLLAHTEAELQQLNLSKWLDRLTDYVHISSIRPVPTDKLKGHVLVQRYRDRHSIEALTRRYAKRKGIGDLGAAKQTQIAGYAARHGVDQTTAALQYDAPRELKNLPFIRLHSLSTGRALSVCIEQRPVQSAQQGLFSTYGLSASTTVPYW